MFNCYTLFESVSDPGCCPLLDPEHSFVFPYTISIPLVFIALYNFFKKMEDSELLESCRLCLTHPQGLQ